MDWCGSSRADLQLSSMRDPSGNRAARHSEIPLATRSGEPPLGSYSSALPVRGSELGSHTPHARQRMAAFLVLAYVAFGLSGAAGLIYETLWARYLTLFLGHSALAQVIVLIIFLGGAAFGAVLAGGLSESVRRPLWLYAVAELVIGICALAFPILYRVTTAFAYERLLPSLGPGALSTLCQLTLAALLILPQSVLLGTTFPAMSAAIMRRIPRGSGRTLASLYFVNGIGGAAGVLVGGFLFVRMLGLPGALLVAGLLSIGAALLALIGSSITRAPVMALSVENGNVGRHGSHNDAMPARREMLLATAFGTAVASLIYEIAWTRMLSLVLGSATHSFELMLSAFILGMSLGALWLRRRADRFREPLRALGRVQVAMGLLAVATLPVYMRSFAINVWIMSAADVTPAGYVLFTVGRYLICLAIMLPATFCAGIALPLITNILLRNGRESVVGLAYGVNTLGSIIGVALGAVVLLPIIGLKALIILAAAIDMAFGVWILVVARARATRRLPILAIAAMLGGIVAASSVDFNRELLTSGTFRWRRLPQPGSSTILFYRDGRTATVSGTLLPSRRIVLATNGKVDASLEDVWLRDDSLGGARRTFSGDQSTQVLLAILAMAHAPTARTAAVIGHGSGMTSHILLGSRSLTSLSTIEIEPQMIAGSNIFYPVNRRVFEDPRSHFVIEDARSFLAVTPSRYDLIVSEPSNPWVSGVASLFTTEFYREASRQLAPGGVFAQWVQVYEINDDLLLGILAAIHANFRSYVIYRSSSEDLVIVAANERQLTPPDWSVVRSPDIAHDFRNLVPLTAESLDALWLSDREVLGPLLDRGIAANSDERPVLDLEAERARYLNRNATGFVGLGGHRFDAFAALARHRLPLATEPQTALPEIPRPELGALSARLRRGVDTEHDTLPPSAEFSSMLLWKRMLEAFLARGASPPDWQLFMHHVAIVEGNMHGGAAGTVDEHFYGMLYRFMREKNAPPRAVAALDFLHGLGAWDFAQASRAADLLMPDARINEMWLPSDTFRDGTVVAKLLTGDVRGARAAFSALSPLNGPPDLRSRILDAHIRAAERTR